MHGEIGVGKCFGIIGSICHSVYRALNSSRVFCQWHFFCTVTPVLANALELLGQHLSPGFRVKFLQSSFLPMAFLLHCDTGVHGCVGIISSIYQIG